MAIVVVGGQTKDIGKTSVVAGIIAAMPEMRWTAIKITQSELAVCAATGEACECVTVGHTVAVREERDGGSGTDSSRYVAAGAVRAFWVRTRVGELAAAMPWITRELAAAENTVIESNSILEFLRPDVYLSVLDPATPDFKESARVYLDRADAVLVPRAAMGGRMLAGRPVLIVEPPDYCTEEVVELVKRLLVG